MFAAVAVLIEGAASRALVMFQQHIIQMPKAIALMGEHLKTLVTHDSVLSGSRRSAGLSKYDGGICPFRWRGNGYVSGGGFSFDQEKVLLARDQSCTAGCQVAFKRQWVAFDEVVVLPADYLGRAMQRTNNITPDMRRGEPINDMAFRACHDVSSVIRHITYNYCQSVHATLLEQN